MGFDGDLRVINQLFIVFFWGRNYGLPSAKLTVCVRENMISMVNFPSKHSDFFIGMVVLPERSREYMAQLSNYNRGNMDNQGHDFTGVYIII